MAQLRWQKHADGSDTLAIARIRWHRTVRSLTVMTVGGGTVTGGSGTKF